MLLSVVINTYNRPDALARCLNHLAAQEGSEPFEVIVIDDGGQADLESVLAPRRDLLQLRLRRIEHGGRSAARNAGVAEADGERIWFLGDDVMTGPGCLARHRAERDALTAVVGPYPWVGLNGSPPFRHWAEPNHQDRIETPNDAGFQFFATGNLSMDRGLFRELGGFDERFELYGWEDIDLGLRFELAGGRIRFDAEARAIHDHPGMTRARLWRREFEMGVTAWQFWNKWATTQRDRIEFMRFWDDPAAIRIGPSWRRGLGGAALAVLDRFAPDSSLNRRLYQRMVFTHRLRGVRDGWRAQRDAAEPGD